MSALLGNCPTAVPADFFPHCEPSLCTCQAPRVSPGLWLGFTAPPLGSLEWPERVCVLAHILSGTGVGFTDPTSHGPALVISVVTGVTRGGVRCGWVFGCPGTFTRGSPFLQR